MRGFVAPILIALFVAPAPLASAQEWARKMFDHTSYDFLGVARGSRIQHIFPLTNIYKEDVHIVGVRSSCGCTSAEFTKDILHTYEKGEIIATFNTRAFTGERGATITVTIDKPFYAEVQLKVSGYIRTDVVLQPPGVEFGSVDVGAAAERRIEINYAGRSDWKIKAIKAPNRYVSAEAVETKREHGNVSYELTVRLAPNAPPGFLNEQLVLVTNDQKETQLPVDIEGQVVAALSVSPASLFLGVLEPGQKITKQLIVRGKKPFRITGIVCGNECFEFKAPETAKTVHVIPVTFSASEHPGKVLEKIRIQTDLAGDVTTECAAYAQVVMPASNPSRLPNGARPETQTTAQSTAR